MREFSNRSVACYDLPLSDDATVLRAEQAILRFPHGATLDIGAVCYLQREAAPIDKRRVRKPHEGHKVVPSSLCYLRVNHIRKFICYVSDELQRLRSATLYGLVGKFYQFLAWADENGHSDALNCETAARAAVRAYTSHIWHRVKSHDISHNTGARLQQDTLSLLSAFLGMDRLARGINLLRRNENETEATEPPSDVDQGRVLRLCEALFDGLTRLVLDEKPYPFGVTMPEYLGYPQNTMWIFPIPVWCLPVMSLGTYETACTGYVFNYSTGRLLTRDELVELKKQIDKDFCISSDSQAKLMKALAKARRHINRANSSSTYRHRKQMGMMAVNCFIPLFLARTGMNWEQMVSLRWSGDYADSVRTIRQKFRSIKHRAGNKEVYFQLPLNFMPHFKRFLQLRRYLLQDYPGFEKLFFRLGLNHIGPPDEVKTSLAVTYRALQRIDPDLAPVLPRKWRAAESNWLTTKTDVSTAALILQTSESNVRKSYAAGGETTHLTEMTAFLERMVLDKEVVLESETSAVGKCVSYGDPQIIYGTAAVAAPDCKIPEAGCLYCDNFKVHADETDVRKLLSCRYCLTRTSHLAGFYIKSEPLINRINLVLDEVHKKDASLVPRVAKEVEEGELDTYWATKYDMLLRLGLVNDDD